MTMRPRSGPGLASMCGTTARAQEVVLLVDGLPITARDIETRSKFIFMSTHKVPARQEVIDGLIDELIGLFRELQPALLGRPTGGP